MALFAVAFPVAPGKSEMWQAFMDELNGPRREEFVASRRAVGVRERVFLQSTPMGDLAIVTFEGDDPAASFAQIMNADDDFTKWFSSQSREAHGFDPSSQPMPAPPTLVLDSEG